MLIAVLIGYAAIGLLVALALEVFMRATSTTEPLNEDDHVWAFVAGIFWPMTLLLACGCLAIRAIGSLAQAIANHVLLVLAEAKREGQSPTGR